MTKCFKIIENKLHIFNYITLINFEIASRIIYSLVCIVYKESVNKKWLKMNICKIDSGLYDVN